MMNKRYENDLLFGEGAIADLKCDFPVRESFKSSLLSRLLELNGKAPEDDDDFKIIHLPDEALSMLSAAGSDPNLPDWFKQHE